MKEVEKAKLITGQQKTNHLMGLNLTVEEAFTRYDDTLACCMSLEVIPSQLWLSASSHTLDVHPGAITAASCPVEVFQLLLLLSRSSGATWRQDAPFSLFEAVQQ